MSARMDELGLSQAELARRVGVAQPTIAKLVSGQSQGSRHIAKIAKELSLPIEYLVGMTDEVEPSNDESGALKRHLAEQLDAVLLPEVEVSYSMGGGSVVDDWPVVQMVPFSRAWLSGLTRSPASELMVARGDGDSMMPTILDQDLVIIDRGQTTPKQQDRIWAMSYGGLGMIKRLRQRPDGSLEINSDNKEVTPIDASDGEVHIVGRVVGVVRKI
jgi:phage repressor protein C with HTH and peptisase S24 domain